MLIGMAPVHGDGLLISDTRAVFKLMQNQPSADCLQKIHYVGPNIIAGFSGSVKIGFRQIAVLKKELGPAKPEYGWNMDQISASWMPGLLLRIYEQSEEIEKSLGSEIILVSAHPHKTHGGSDAPWMDAVRFSSPEFLPEKSAVNTPIFAGDSAAINRFRRPLKEVMKHLFSIQMLLEGQPEQASVIAGLVRDATDDGSHYQVGLITRGKSVILASHPELKFADSYGAYIKYCAENHLEPSSAIA